MEMNRNVYIDKMNEVNATLINYFNIWNNFMA